MMISIRLLSVQALALAFVLVPGGGCSFGLSGPEEGPHVAGQPPRCTTSRARPIADTVGAAVFGGAGFAFLLATCGPGDHDQEVDQTCEGITNAFGVLLLVPAAIYAVSAVGGYSKTGRCRDAVRAHQSRPVR